MGKTAVFAVTCSIVVFVLFGVSCFLMTTVNPPPMVEVANNTTEKTLRFGDNLSKFYLRNIDPSDILEYGLEKAYNSSGHSSPSPVYLRANLSNYIPTVKNKNPYLVKVHPPIFPQRNTSSLTSKEFKLTTKTTNVHHKENATNVTKESQIHRRSINVIEKNIDANTGAVILKILDNDGKSRIEIKLNPNEVFGKKKSRPHRSFPEIDPELEDEELNNTEIKILPNDTVIINTSDDLSETIDVRTKHSDVDYKPTIDDGETVDLTNLLYRTESNAANILVDIKTVEATMNSVNQFKTVTKEIVGSNETKSITQNYEGTLDVTKTNLNKTNNFGLKIMFDNVTKSFTEPYDNNDFQNKTR